MPALTILGEGTETLSALSETTSSLGFFPGTSLYSAPFPFPGPTSYPGDSIGVPPTVMSEGTETLTVLTEV